ncbi:hypothetical protein [Pseudomonas ovata]|uniref:hypothetical protein n=1 Tax=Pseudomonas ovata TaxID=1839709 RepID=UPI000D68FF10|nr:hypothetical protein [Pseudomonas ovata]
MVYRLKMEDAGIVVGKAGQRCALAPLQGGMPRQSAVGARLPATECAALAKLMKRHKLIVNAFRNLRNATNLRLLTQPVAGKRAPTAVNLIVNKSAGFFEDRRLVGGDGGGTDVTSRQ